MLIRYGLGSMDVTRGSYVQWAAQVKAAGGVVTNAPHATGNVPAARFPIAAVFPNAPDTTLAPGFTRLPDDFSDSGAYVYFIAPSDAVAYADTAMLQAGAFEGDATGNPPWVDALRGIGKDVLVGVLVTAAVAYAFKRKRG